MADGKDTQHNILVVLRIRRVKMEDFRILGVLQKTLFHRDVLVKQTELS